MHCTPHLRRFEVRDVELPDCLGNEAADEWAKQSATDRARQELMSLALRGVIYGHGVYSTGLPEIWFG